MQNHQMTVEQMKARVDRAAEELAAQDGDATAQSQIKGNLCLDLEYMIMALRAGMRPVESERTSA